MDFQAFFQKLRKNWIATAAVTILAGLVLVLFPGETLKGISYVVGGIAIVMGAVRTVRYFKQTRADPFLFQSDLMVGLLSVGFGLFLVTSPEKVLSLLPFLLGIVLAGCGVGSVLRALDAKNAGLSAWGVLLALAVISIAAGVVCMVNPFAAMETTVIVIGAALIYVGVTDLVTMLTVGRRVEAWKEKETANP